MLLEICLPVKDEGKILAANLLRIINFCDRANLPFSWQIMGLSNGSSDQTVEIFSEFKKRYPGKVDYREILEPGRGRAIKQRWLESEADVVCYLDIDLAVLPDQIPLLVEPLFSNQADLAIGSRLLPGASINRSRFREFISRVFNALARVLLPNKATDLQCGFKAARTDFFKQIAPLIKDNYWFFDSELVILCQRMGYRLQEIPVNWNENRYEKRQSKVKIIRDILKFIKNMIKLRWRIATIPRN